jgi:hypothetical protein
MTPITKTYREYTRFKAYLIVIVIVGVAIADDNIGFQSTNRRENEVGNTYIYKLHQKQKTKNKRNV